MLRLLTTENYYVFCDMCYDYYTVYIVYQQVAWVHSCKVDAKRPGVLAPFAKLPTLVDRMQVSLLYILS
jgi:hypothetical protein